MKRWFHYAHLSNIYVKEGQHIQNGQKIATVGRSGGWKNAHLHWEVRCKNLDPSYWPKGQFDAFVASRYEDPLKFLHTHNLNYPMRWSHTGYEFLERMQDGTFHPGVDLNYGAPNADLGMEISSPCNGVVVFAGEDPGIGFGKHIIVEHEFELPEGGDGDAMTEEEKKQFDDLVKDVRNAETLEEGSTLRKTIDTRLEREFDEHLGPIKETLKDIKTKLSDLEDNQSGNNSVMRNNAKTLQTLNKDVTYLIGAMKNVVTKEELTTNRTETMREVDNKISTALKGGDYSERENCLRGIFSTFNSWFSRTG